jgi:hypothetical protein
LWALFLGFIAFSRVCRIKLRLSGKINNPFAISSNYASIGCDLFSIDYLTSWANLRKTDCAPRTHAAYAQVAR